MSIEDEIQAAMEEAYASLSPVYSAPQLMVVRRNRILAWFKQQDAIRAWCADNLLRNVRYEMGTFYIENPTDAAHFILRWSDIFEPASPEPKRGRPEGRPRHT